MYSLLARYYFLLVTTRVSLPHFHGFLILSTLFSETFASRASGRTSCYPANIIPGHSPICEMRSNFLCLRTYWPSEGPNGSLSIFNVYRLSNRRDVTLCAQYKLLTLFHAPRLASNVLLDLGLALALLTGSPEALSVTSIIVTGEKRQFVAMLGRDR